MTRNWLLPVAGAPGGDASDTLGQAPPSLEESGWLLDLTRHAVRCSDEELDAFETGKQRSESEIDGEMLGIQWGAESREESSRTP